MNAPFAVGLAVLLTLPCLAQEGVQEGGLYAKRFADYETKFAQAGDSDEDVQAALLRAHLYLAQSQRPEGSWAAGHSNDMAPMRDIGVTSLACLALMESGNSPEEGSFKMVLRAGLDWLVTQQDAETGLVGERVGHSYLYDHAIATLALSKASGGDNQGQYRQAAQAAVNLALRARNPYGAWRYDFPPLGDNDTSVTGWMVAALTSAESAGLRVDSQAFMGAVAWIDEVTDPETGRVGYDSRGSRSSRIPGVNDQFPPERGEGMTAVGLYARLLMGQSRKLPAVQQHAALLLKNQPSWDPSGLGTDMYYWYFGTRAMHAMGAKHWAPWRRSVVDALLESQDEDGGWPAVGPWGVIGGRAYATALMASCLALDSRDDLPFESELAEATPMLEDPPERPIIQDYPVVESTPVSPADAARSKAAVDRAVNWLVANQEQDGHWDLTEFPSKVGPYDIGVPIHEVGVTGLALLALQGAGHSTLEGEHRAAVLRAVKWLRGVQDRETGLLGEDVGHSFLYDHGIATAALAEAYRVSRNPILKPSVQHAVNYIARARNPYGAWRYDVPPVGDNDTSVTTWMVIALKTAQSAGLAVDLEAYQGAKNWIQTVTDPATGRVGYDSQGSASSRVVGVNEEFPTERGEAMTGAGLFIRQLLGEKLTDDASLRAGAQLLLRQQPEWAPGEFACDYYYWMHGSNAAYLVGGRHRANWSTALRRTLLPNQRADGDLAGSWDPIDPWSYAGGRVYSTALAALALEADFVAPTGSRDTTH